MEKIVKATEREKRPLRGAEKIGVRVGRVLGRFKVGKHFRLEITDTSFRFERDPQRIEDEARLDGIYVIRATVPKEEMAPEAEIQFHSLLPKLSGLEADCARQLLITASHPDFERPSHKEGGRVPTL